MAIMNLLKGSWTGKLGQTVGAKWKNKNTLRTYSKPAYTDTPAQREVRHGFGFYSRLFATFTESMKPYSALDTRGQSLRNALIQLNKDLVAIDEEDITIMKISKGGLVLPQTITQNYDHTMNKLTITWSHPGVANLSTKARFCAACYHPGKNLGVFGTALYSAGTMSFQLTDDWHDDLGYRWAYLLDYRGSSKVASPSTLGVNIA